MNKFTLIIHNKGWTVTDACERWGIHYDTYNRRCNDEKFHPQLEDMCRGLPHKYRPGKSDVYIFGESTTEVIGSAFERIDNENI